MLCQHITTTLDEAVEVPHKIVCMEDSECTISLVKCYKNILKDWFTNKVAEILDHIKSRKLKGIFVSPLYNWLGERNISDILTKGKAVASDLGPGSEWQCRPAFLSRNRDKWLASRAFKRKLPDEELIQGSWQLHVMTRAISGFSPIINLMDKHRSLKLIVGIIARIINASSNNESILINTDPTP